MLFPDGRFVPRWVRWILPLLLVFLAAWAWPSNSPFSTVQWTFPLLSVRSVLFLVPVCVQLYRLRRPSSQIERQQTRLVAFAIVITLLADVGFASPLFTFSEAVHTITSVGLYALALYLLPLALGVAILRYRLWDIDLLINRTLVYGTLTLLLTGVYVGLVIGLQALLRGLISQDSSVVIVASTLVIYALFWPLRGRLQALIDRRFYRRKYDAARTLAAFSATLRTEVDLDQLREELLAIVQDTMQPTSVSLWVRPPAPSGTQHASRSTTLAGSPEKEASKEGR